MNLLRKIVRLNRYQLAAQLFTPIVVAGIFYIANMKLVGFIIFQFFIEIFVLWHFSIGLTLSVKDKSTRLRNYFIFNMLFALIYRMGSNGFQIWHRINFGDFPEIEQMLWLIPIHLYASFGSIYCFYLNSKWIVAAEGKLGAESRESIRKTFWQILIFPIGLWFIQPRLNKISISI